MNYDVSTIIDELAGVFHGTTINKITNLGGVMNRAARQLLLDCNPIETKRIAQLGQIFNSIYDYSIPDDLKGVQVIDIRPQAGRYPSDQYEQAYARWFDAYKRNGWNNAFNVQHDTGVKSLRLEAPSLASPLTITATDSLTGWTATGTASNLSLDTTYNPAGGGALQFDVTTGTGAIQITTLSKVDLSTHVGIATEYYLAYFPSVPTSVSLILGNDVTANYYTFNATAQANGTAFKVGWNIIGVSWVGLTATGAPVATQYDSVKFSVVASTAMVGVKFCNLTSILGAYFEMVYYSKFLFSNGGIWKENITDIVSADQSTIINLDTESYGLYFNLLAYYITQQLMGSDAQKDGQFFLQEYQRSLKRYTAMYKSETALPSEPWYKLPNNRGINFGPRWWS